MRSGPHRFNARQTRQALFELAEELSFALPWIASGWQSELKRQHISGFEAGLRVLQRDKRADQQSRGRQKRQRERNFCHYERALQPPAVTRSGSLPSSFERHL